MCVGGLIETSLGDVVIDLQVDVTYLPTRSDRTLYIRGVLEKHVSNAESDISTSL